MITFQLNKLVRDKFIGIYTDKEQKPTYRLLQSTELRQQLAGKLIEEAQELLAVEPEKVVDELADIQQVLDDLKKLHGVSDAELTAAQRTKLAQKGGFTKGVFIETLTLQDDDPWVDYYRQEPERFPEVTSK